MWLIGPIRSLRTYTHENAIIDEICVNKMSMDLGHFGVLDALIYRF